MRRRIDEIIAELYIISMMSSFPVSTSVLEAIRALSEASTQTTLEKMPPQTPQSDQAYARQAASRQSYGGQALTT